MMTGPLNGTRVIDVTRALAGPFGAMMLGDLGAEVIKVEPPEGDDTRRLSRDYHHGESIYYCSVNRNKKDIVLDLKGEEGRKVLYDLVRVADVVIDNYRAGVTTRLGIDYDTLVKHNPKIITCSITGFAGDGPYRDRPAYDLAIQAIAGTMSLNGEPDGKPLRLGVPMGDLAGGLYAVQSICAALFQRERTGRGQRVDITLVDAQVSLLTYQGACYLHSGIVPKAVGDGHASAYPYGNFLTKDDQWLAIAIWENHFWKAFCLGIGMEELIDDPRFDTNDKRFFAQEELGAILRERFRERTLDEWVARLATAGVPAGAVNKLDRALSDPEIAERGMVVSMDHPLGGSVRAIGSPMRFAGSPTTYVAAPLYGQHSKEIMTEVLGYPPERVEDLLGRKIVRDHK